MRRLISALLVICLGIYIVFPATAEDVETNQDIKPVVLDLEVDQDQQPSEADTELVTASTMDELMAAVDAAATGDTIAISKTIFFNEGSLTTDKQLTLVYVGNDGMPMFRVNEAAGISGFALQYGDAPENTLSNIISVASACGEYFQIVDCNFECNDDSYVRYIDIAGGRLDTNKVKIERCNLNNATNCTISVKKSTDVYIDSCLISGSVNSKPGGAITNSGNLHVTGTVITGCSGVSGGGIFNSGTLDITDSHIYGNTVSNSKYGSDILSTGTLSFSTMPEDGTAYYNEDTSEKVELPVTDFSGRLALVCLSDETALEYFAPEMPTVDTLNELLDAIDCAADGDVITVSQTIMVDDDCIIGMPDKRVSLVRADGFIDSMIGVIGGTVQIQMIDFDGKSEENVLPAVTSRDASVKVEKCGFYDNAACAISFLDGGSCSVIDCDFCRNYSPLTKGLIGDVLIEGCRFIENTGLSACITLSGNVTFKDCTFEDNHTIGVDGGVILYSDEWDGVCSIESCTFFGNSVTEGRGAAILNGGNISITQSVFVDNFGGVSGSDLSAFCDGRFTVTNTDAELSRLYEQFGLVYVGLFSDNAENRYVEGGDSAPIALPLTGCTGDFVFAAYRQDDEATEDEAQLPPVETDQPPESVSGEDSTLDMPEIPASDNQSETQPPVETPQEPVESGDTSSDVPTEESTTIPEKSITDGEETDVPDLDEDQAPGDSSEKTEPSATDEPAGEPTDENSEEEATPGTNVEESDIDQEEDTPATDADELDVDQAETTISDDSPEDDPVEPETPEESSAQVKPNPSDDTGDTEEDTIPTESENEPGETEDLTFADDESESTALIETETPEADESDNSTEEAEQPNPGTTTPLDTSQEPHSGTNGGGHGNNYSPAVLRPVSGTQESPQVGNAGAEKPTLTCGKAVLDCTRSVILQGYGDGFQHEDDPLTRAQMATLIYRLITEDSAVQLSNPAYSFDDVNANDWYAPYVLALAEAGVVNGVGHGRFDPDGMLTWAQFLTMFGRFVEPQHCTLQYIRCDAWAQQAIETMVSLGMIKDSADFDADALVTRGDAVDLINSLLFVYRL